MGKISRDFHGRFEAERIALYVARGEWTKFSEGWPDTNLPNYVRLSDGKVMLAQRYDPKHGWLPAELNGKDLVDWTPTRPTWAITRRTPSQSC